MNLPSFTLSAVHAAASCLTQAEQWQHWAANDDDCAHFPEQTPDLSFLPPMQRRRLGLTARLAFSAAHPILSRHADCPMVFVSHDGEIKRSFEMWAKLFRENEVSPTAFGLSVHNALIGQLSMHYRNRCESTAISACEAGWEIGVMEACALLAEGADKVLLIAADEPVPPHITIDAPRAPFPYAVAALITHGDQWQLSRQTTATVPASACYWGALRWYRHFLHNTPHWQQHYARESWLWRKKI